MSTAYIDKEKFSEIINWCFEYLDLYSWKFDDGPCRITFNDDASRLLFALKWGT